MRQRILDGDRARLAVVDIRVDAAEAGQDVGLFPRGQVRAVELGRDVDRQIQTGPGGLHPFAVGQGAHHVAPQLHHRLDTAGQQRVAGVARVQAVLRRCVDVEIFLQLVGRHVAGLFADAHGALALHVGMPPDRRDAGAGLAEVAAHQQQVDQHPEVQPAADMLGQAHAVDRDAALRGKVDVTDILDLGARQARDLLDLVPAEGIDGGDGVVEADGVGVDEVLIQHRAGGRAFGGEHAFHQAAQHRDIAAGADLQKFLAQLRALVGQHLERTLRIDEFKAAAFAQRVEGDDPAAVFHGLFQIPQEPRAVHPGVLAEEQDRVAFLKILEHAGPDRGADQVLQVHGRRLVAHVRRLRQVLVPHCAGEEGVEERRLDPRMAGGVEDHLFGVHRLEGAGDGGGRVVPADRQVAVAVSVVAHRVGQTARGLEFVIRPGPQLCQGVVGKEVGPGAALVQLPQGGADAGFADFQRVRFLGLGPGAGRTHHPAVLVEPVQDLGRLERDGRILQHGGDFLDGPPAAGGVDIGLDAGVLAIGVMGGVVGGFGHRSGLAAHAGRPDRSIPDPSIMERRQGSAKKKADRAAAGPPDGGVRRSRRARSGAGTGRLHGVDPARA